MSHYFPFDCSASSALREYKTLAIILSESCRYHSNEEFIFFLSMLANYWELTNVNTFCGASAGAVQKLRCSFVHKGRCPPFRHLFSLPLELLHYTAAIRWLLLCLSAASCINARSRQFYRKLLQRRFFVSVLEKQSRWKREICSHIIILLLWLWLVQLRQLFLVS